MKEPVCYLSKHPRMEATPEFIERNHLSLSRSTDEILERAEKGWGKSLDFTHEVLGDYLPFDTIKHWYKAEFVEVVANGEKTAREPITSLTDAVQDFLDYMNFAWEKAEDERGISACRSIEKLSTWLWLFGRDDLRRLIDDDELYNPYGAPALIAVCNEMGIVVPESLKAFAQHQGHSTDR